MIAAVRMSRAGPGALPLDYGDEEGLNSRRIVLEPSKAARVPRSAISAQTCIRLEASFQQALPLLFKRLLSCPKPPDGGFLTHENQIQKVDALLELPPFLS